MQIDINKLIDEWRERVIELDKEMERLNRECPYRKHHDIMPNGYCLWCGEHGSGKR